MRRPISERDAIRSQVIDALEAQPASSVLLIGVLKDAAFFLADPARQIKLDVRLTS
jgi:hypoxanthine-guanine phosphoribosyltransferase